MKKIVYLSLLILLISKPLLADSLWQIRGNVAKNIYDTLQVDLDASAGHVNKIINNMTCSFTDVPMEINKQEISANDTRRYVCTFKTDAAIYYKNLILVNAKNPYFIIQLKSNPTTGFSWQLENNYKNKLTLIKHRFIAPQNKKLMGAPGMESWQFKINNKRFKNGEILYLNFNYRRPWIGGEKGPSQQFKIMLIRNL